MTAVLQHPGYAEEKLQRVAERLPCREVQAGMLLSLMGQVGSQDPGYRDPGPGPVLGLVSRVQP